MTVMERVERIEALGTFRIPPGGEAGTPPELRHPDGRLGSDARGNVRLMVAHRSTGEIAHRRFGDLADALAPGDVVVVNASAVIPAALDARAPDGTAVRLHLSTEQPGGFWVVEPRLPAGVGSVRYVGQPPRLLHLPGGGRAELLAPYPASRAVASDPGALRLWLAWLDLPDVDAPQLDEPLVSPFAELGSILPTAETHHGRTPAVDGGLDPAVAEYLAAHGQPIRYEHADEAWPLEAYQTVFARVPGSVEMPSAARPFTHRLVTELVARGVTVVPIALHTGVSSQEAGEPPYAERFAVSPATADIVNAARSTGGRIVAVGTTVVRALESTADAAGRAHPGQGWTDLVVTPERGVRVVDGLVTGWHEPESSHLALLETVAGRDLLDGSYREAVSERYRWHEFGDSHLILP
jgi:S-adenosylmethionine:tRNA ribosyltransferase-isomerase